MSVMSGNAVLFVHIGESLTASPERQKHREKREVSPLTSVSLGVADMKIEVTPSSPTQTSSTLIRLSPPSSSSPNLGSPVHGGYQGSFSPTLVPISSGAPTESALMVQSTMTKAKSLVVERDRETQRESETERGEGDRERERERGEGDREREVKREREIKKDRETERENEWKERGEVDVHVPVCISLYFTGSVVM